MKSILYFLIIVSILFSGCTDKPKDRYDEFYVVLDDIMRISYSDADVIIPELMKVMKPAYEPNDSTPPSPPPGIGSIHYDKRMFRHFIEDKLLDSSEVEYMYKQIGTLKDYTLDTSRIEKPCFSNVILDSVFRTNGDLSGAYDILESKYHASSFIRISNPLISEDGNKMLFDIETYCGSQCGGGVTYLVEKKNGKWRVISSFGTWIS